MGAHQLPDTTGLWQGELGVEPGPGRPGAAFQNAEVVSIDGAGHWVHHDKLDEFVALTRKFLKR